MMAFLAAVVVAGAVAAFAYRGGLGDPWLRVAAFARLAGVAALLALLLDPGVVARLAARRPLVLLDNSVSMHAAQGRLDEARRLAASLGDTITFGELAPGIPGARSDLGTALEGAIAGGRPIVVVTDGEISDASLLSPDLLSQVSVRGMPRTAGSNTAVTRVTAPARASASDTVRVAVEVRATHDSGQVEVELREGAAVLARLRMPLSSGSGSGTLSFVATMAQAGERWLTIERVGTTDAEPDDDRRAVHLVVTPTPGVVVLATSPDWDARFLQRTLVDVVETPVRGYVQLAPGEWRRSDDLRPVPASDVAAAARAADLLVVRGDTTPWRAAGRARLLWPIASTAGDWYLGASGASPLSGAFAGLDPDSLPPALAVTPLDPSSLSWVGATARLSRRGSAVPVIGGRDRGGRTAVIAVDGLYRWSFRGGTADQAWRTMIGDVAAWLLAAPDAGGSVVRLVDAVTERGRPVRFRWTGDGPARAVPVTITRDGASRDDTLRFDASGVATLAVEPGRYAYRAEGASGTFEVERYAEELLPRPVTLAAREASVSPAPARRSLREWWWLFGLAIASFGGEWMIRRKTGLT